MTESKIWRKLRAQGKILMNGDQVTYVIVVQHLADSILERIAHNKRKEYNDDYIQAAKDEIVERNILGKKRIKL